MPRTQNRLTAVKVSGAKVPGYYADGVNLYLKITPAGSKSWIFRFTRDGPAMPAWRVESPYWQSSQKCGAR